MAVRTRIYTRERMSVDVNMYLGTNMDKAVEATIIADRTTEVNGSGTAFLEYRELPSEDTDGEMAESKKSGRKISSKMVVKNSNKIFTNFFQTLNFMKN